MTNSNVYQIRLTQNFDITYCKLLRTHYKKDSKFKKEFEQLIVEITDKLESNPYSNTLSRTEPFPKNCANQYIELRKIRWKKLPGLQSLASMGRLIFLVIKPSKTIYFLWIYTHEEYPKRPPDKDLKRLVLDICLEEKINIVNN